MVMMLVVVVMMMLVIMVVFVLVLMLMVMMMFMLVFRHQIGFIDTVHRDFGMCPVDPAFHGRNCFHMNAGQSQRVDTAYKSFPVGKKFKQSGCEHVAGGAHAAVKVERFHWLIFSCQ